MSIWQVDGETPRSDVREHRINAGTVGGEHAVPGSFTGAASAGVVSPFDPRVAYHGSWSLDIGTANQLDDYLGRSLETSVPGSSVSLAFTGTSITVIGQNNVGGGFADVYIDGVLTQGRVNTYTFLSASYALGGLNTSDTTILVSDTSDFASSGSIVVDGEVVTYTSVTGGGTPSFNGCTRTGTFSHLTGAMVYQYSSLVNLYSPYRQGRVAVWRNTLLSPGQHTIRVVLRSDKDAGSTGTNLHLGGFTVGGILGAYNINTYVDYLTITGVTFGADGVSNAAPTPIFNSTTNQQLLSVLGAVAYNGATRKPCFASYDPTDGTWQYYCPTGASSTLKVIVTLLIIGPSV